MHDGSYHTLWTFVEPPASKGRASLPACQANGGSSILFSVWIGAKNLYLWNFAYVNGSYRHAAMISFRTRNFRAHTLVVAAIVWLVSVTLCSTQALAEQAEHDHEHDAAEPHAHHCHDSAHHGDQGDHCDDGGCGCESFKAFPANTAPLSKAPAPLASLLLHHVFLDEFTFESVAIAIIAQNTGPPGRLSPDELILQVCRFSHAPPFVV